MAEEATEIYGGHLAKLLKLMRGHGFPGPPTSVSIWIGSSNNPQEEEIEERLALIHS